jgi:hypothetical protein
MGTIAMMVAADSASYAADSGSAETAHVSATNGASKGATAMTAATMTACAATRLRVAGKQAAGHSGGH